MSSCRATTRISDAVRVPQSIRHIFDLRTRWRRRQHGRHLQGAPSGDHSCHHLQHQTWTQLTTVSPQTINTPGRWGLTGGNEFITELLHHWHIDPQTSFSQHSQCHLFTLITFMSFTSAEITTWSLVIDHWSVEQLRWKSNHNQRRKISIPQNSSWTKIIK